VAGCEGHVCRRVRDDGVEVAVVVATDDRHGPVDGLEQCEQFLAFLARGFANRVTEITEHDDAVGCGLLYECQEVLAARPGIAREFDAVPPEAPFDARVVIGDHEQSPPVGGRDRCWLTGNRFDAHQIVLSVPSLGS
jgi:hypothetical protein